MGRGVGDGVGVEAPPLQAGYLTGLSLVAEGLLLINNGEGGNRRKDRTREPGKCVVR